MEPLWQHLTIAAAVILAAWLAARLVDWRISRHDLPAEAVTRYRVLRRLVVAAIASSGVMSALLVIPQVRAVAGGVLASSAVVGLVVGFAAQRTIGNLVAGLLIAIAQPLRLGDEVEVQGVRGVVEEIGLTYTWLRTESGDRLVVPNEKLASDSIRNFTIRGRETVAEATVEVPLGSGLAELLAALEGDGDEAYVSGLSADRATILVRRRVPNEAAVERAASDLRASRRLARHGVGLTSQRVSRRSRHDDLDFILAQRGRKRKRGSRIRRRRRAGLIVATLAIVVVITVLTLGIGAGAALSEGCNLNSLQAGGDRRRTHSSTRATARCSARSRPSGTASRWRLRRCRSGCRWRRSRSRTAASTSTAASTTWASLVPPGRTSPPARSSRAARRSRSSSSATSTPDARRRSTASSRRRASRSSCRASGRSRRSSNEYLNTVYYGNHAYGVEAASQTYFSRHAKDLTLLQSALLAGLPQAPSDVRPVPQPAGSARAPRRGAAALLRSGDDHTAAVRHAIRARSLGLEAGPYLHAHQAAVLLLVRDRRARAPVRREHRARGRAEGLHDDRPAPAAPRDQGDPRRPAVHDRSGGGDRLGRAGHRCDPRDDGGRAQVRATSSISPRSRRVRRARRSRPSCSRRRSRRESTRTRRTTPPRRSRARSGPGAAPASRGRCTPTTTPTADPVGHARDAAVGQHRSTRS